MENKILAPISLWFRNSIFAPTRLQKRVFSKSKNHDGRARATCKAYCSTKASGTKGKAISRKHKPNKRYAESNFIPLLQ